MRPQRGSSVRLKRLEPIARAMPAARILDLGRGGGHPLARHVGKTMLVAVGIFGMATIMFGCARTMPLALLSLFVSKKKPGRAQSERATGQ